MDPDINEHHDFRHKKIESYSKLLQTTKISNVSETKYGHFKIFEIFSNAEMTNAWNRDFFEI